MYSYKQILKNSQNYPDFVSKRDFCDMCGICPYTAYKLLKSKTISYIKRRVWVQGPNRQYLEHHYDIPKSEILSYVKEKCSVSECSEDDIIKIRKFYELHLATYPDMLKPADICAITGYAKESVRRWIDKGLIEAYLRKEKYYIAKDDLIEFLVSDSYRNIIRKSDLNIYTDSLIKNILQ